MSLDHPSVLDALEGVRALVQPDGGDIELVSVDPTDGTASLRLLLEGANCAECVLPRPMLEAIAADVMRKTVPALRSVTIEDPREAEGYETDDH